LANNQIIISRIQNRRGLKENLPQPLLPGEIALTVDTGELWIGSDLNQPPYGVRTYSAGIGDISTAETIVDTQVVSAKFTADLAQAEFDSLVEYLIDPSALATEGAPAVVLVEDDIRWDGLAAVFIAADIAVDPANTINNILEAIELEPSVPGTVFDSANSGALGTLNDPFVAIDITGVPTLTFADAGPDTITRSLGSFVTDGFFDGQKIIVSGTGSNDGTYTIDAGGTTATVLTLVAGDTLANEGPIAATIEMLRGRTDPAASLAFDSVDGDYQFGGLNITSNAAQGSNAAILINELNGAGLVTTFGNLQITTSGIGVGTPTFRDMTVTDTDSGFAWSATGTASADSTTDELTFVSGTNINVDVDPVLDAIRISNTAEADPDKIITGFTQAPLGSDIQTEYILSANEASFIDIPNFLIDIDNDSDVIFVEYSANIGGAAAGSNNYTALGRMRIVGNTNAGASGMATLVDDQTEVRDEAGDADWGNVQLFADFDGVDAATAFTEESTNAAVATFNGSAELDTAQFNGATSSLLLDGVDSDVTFPDISAYDLSTNEWTIEGWVRMATLPPNGGGSGGPGFALATLSYDDGGAELLSYVLAADGFGERVMARYAGTFEQNTTTMAINTWYHWAMCKTAANDVRLYFNGNYRTGDFGAISADMGTASVALRIGSRDGATEFTDGWIDDVRFTNGTARYTGNTTYTIPTAPLEGALAPITGDINFEADFVPGSPNQIQMQYKNTFTSNATLRVALRRWMSY